MHFTPLILLNAHWLLLGWLWVTCLIVGIYQPYRTRTDGTTYAWSLGSIFLAIFGILALVAWLLSLLGFITV